MVVILRLHWVQERQTHTNPTLPGEKQLQAHSLTHPPCHLHPLHVPFPLPRTVVFKVRSLGLSISVMGNLLEI